MQVKLYTCGRHQSRLRKYLRKVLNADTYVMICVMFEVIVVGGLKEPQKFCVAGCVPQSHGLLQ